MMGKYLNGYLQSALAGPRDLRAARAGTSGTSPGGDTRSTTTR